ncbi:hypothetical protein [Nocardioides immobilis]|nr:hypothetical protein [Nocardioides immobilis]
MTNATRPDLDGLISGGQGRRRRRNLTVLGGAAAAVVLVGGGIFGITQLGSDDDDIPPAEDPSVAETSDAPVDEGPPPYVDRNGLPLEPGTYRKTVGFNDTRDIQADLTFGDGWDASGDPFTGTTDRDWAVLAIYQLESLPGESACVAVRSGAEPWGQPGRPAGETTQEVARQLTTLPGATVLEPPERGEAFGYPAHHLQVRIVDSCDDVYVVANATDGGHGISYYQSLNQRDRVVVIDFQVVDVDGTPIVVELVHHREATQETVARATAVRDSITFVLAE